MFQYPLLKGNVNATLKEPYSIVLTEATAISLFGKEDPINKTVRFDNITDLRVTAVLKDIPRNSTFQFNYLIPFSYYSATSEWVKNSATDWGNNSFQTFVALQPNVSYAQVEPKLKPLLLKYSSKIYKPTKAEVFMQPMKDWHLYSEFKNGFAVGRLRFKGALNQNIRWASGKQHVIGVVKDALMMSLFAPAEPTFFVYQPTWENTIMYRLSPRVNTHDAIEKLTVIFNKYNPSFPYLYHFVDETYAAKFDLEVLVGKLAGLFAALAIFISCLGLFRLAAYMAEQ